MADLAASLGLGTNLGSNSAMSRTVGRLVMFDCARRAGDTLAVRLALPDMPPNRLARMPASVRLAHQHLTSPHRPGHDTPAGQAAQLAEGVAI